jgi:predicted O-methyltransferase YrrM
VTSRDSVATLARESRDRLELWSAFLSRVGAREVAELGVYRGVFAERILADCPAITRYYMIDPWRHLDDWNKPANRDDAAFQRVFDEAMKRTAQHAGRTTEVIDRIPDGSLDFAYIDGDHTLRGITADLVRIHPKIRMGGWIGGDDFVRSIWQHGRQFEPTLVFPFAVYFAEAVGARIYGLPFGQFLLEKQADTGFEFVDVAGKYDNRDLLSQMGARPAPSGLHRLRRKLSKRLGG